MSTENTQVAVLAPNLAEIALKLNSSVQSVIGQDKIEGFERAYLLANAISELKRLLTPEYMKPIMEMQGNKLGFKTDKDKDGGYPENIVKNCLIEAVLFGLQPCGNHFNIIAGNMYATKEGCGYLLNKMNGLYCEITSELPRMGKESAAVVMNIDWTIGGITKSKKLDIPIKVNNFMGTDAVLGKATRKARKWLLDTLTGMEIPEGDVSDSVVMATTIHKSQEEKDIDLINEQLDREDLTAEMLMDIKKKTPADLWSNEISHKWNEKAAVLIVDQQ